ncbi:MAG: DUF3102 domain-containing protein [Limnohabitans sp.]|nr:DUF3102 domain-containing protein [Limnohabitans sp.]
MSQNEKALPVAHLESEATQALQLTDVSAHEMELAAFLEVDMAAPAPVLLSRIRQDAETGLRLVITMGLRLLALKAKTAHGEFEGKLDDVGVSVREAQKCMQTARVFASETDNRRREQILHLGKTKGMALLATNPEVRDQILESEELASEAAEATKRELENTIKTLERDLKRVQTEKNDLEQINAGLTKKKLKSDLRADTQLVRDECLHQQALCDYGAQALLKAWNSVVEEPLNAPEHHLRRDQIVLAARAAAAATAKVLYEILESAGEEAVMYAGSEHMLTAEEAAAWANEWETLKSGHTAKDAARFDRAQADLPRDVGRPKGSKTKTEGKGA